MIRNILGKVAVIIGIVAATLVTFGAGLGMFGTWHDEWSGYAAQFMVSDGVCNVAIVPVEGFLTTTETGFAPEDLMGTSVALADDVLFRLRAIEAEETVGAFLIRIDSTGGTPVASEMITDQILRSGKPNAALIREYGTSGGYMIASAADRIFASALSDVGSIGVTSSYLQNVEQNRQEGLEYVSLSSAKFKDAGDPNKPLTEEERALFERDLRAIHDYFVAKVADNRKMQVVEIAELADGSAMTGARALEQGLIDEIGDQETTRAWFANALAITPEEVLFCE